MSRHGETRPLLNPRLNAFEQAVRQGGHGAALIAADVVVKGGDRHVWSIEDLHAGVLATGLSADYSSVFRAVNWLEGQGVIGQVALGDSRVHYELAGPN